MISLNRRSVVRLSGYYSTRLYAEIPNIQIITCHDEIYFEQKFKTQVETIWNEELKKVYETLPSIEYGEENDIKETFVNDEELDFDNWNDRRNWRMLDFNEQEDVYEAEI